jgi:hypothetical protein
MTFQIVRNPKPIALIARANDGRLWVFHFESRVYSFWSAANFGGQPNFTKEF